MLTQAKNALYAFTILIMLLVVISTQSEVRADFGGDQDPGYLAFAEEMPEVEGGLAKLYNQIQYPDLAKKAGITGKVYVMAFIDETGSVNDVQVIKGIGGGCDEAAVEVIKKTKFVPGKNKGQPIKVKMSLPIIFQLK